MEIIGLITDFLIESHLIDIFMVISLGIVIVGVFVLITAIIEKIFE